MSTRDTLVDEILQKLCGVTLTKREATSITECIRFSTMPDPPNGTVEFLAGTTRPVAIWYQGRRWEVSTVSDGSDDPLLKFEQEWDRTFDRLFSFFAYQFGEKWPELKKEAKRVFHEAVLSVRSGK